MALCGSYVFEFSVNKDTKKDIVDFGRREINEQQTHIKYEFALGWGVSWLYSRGPHERTHTA